MIFQTHKFYFLWTNFISKYFTRLRFFLLPNMQIQSINFLHSSSCSHEFSYPPKSTSITFLLFIFSILQKTNTSTSITWFTSSFLQLPFCAFCYYAAFGLLTHPSLLLLLVYWISFESCIVQHSTMSLSMSVFCFHMKYFLC